MSLLIGIWRIFRTLKACGVFRKNATQKPAASTTYGSFSRHTLATVDVLTPFRDRQQSTYSKIVHLWFGWLKYFDFRKFDIVKMVKNMSTHGGLGTLYLTANRYGGVSKLKRIRARRLDCFRNAIMHIKSNTSQITVLN